MNAESRRSRVRAWRLQRAELRLADAEHYYWKWVEPFHEAPSVVRRHKRKIESLTRKVERLRDA